MLKDNDEARCIFGQYDTNLHFIERIFPVGLFARGNVLNVKGKTCDVKKVEELILKLKDTFRRDNAVRYEDIESAVNAIAAEDRNKGDGSDGTVFLTDKTRHVSAKTSGQRTYMEAMRKFDIVFAIGPAGTGKTYLACASALEALKSGRVSRIILTRPVVEAGEKLGFLPGDLYEKINPYLAPLYDSFSSILGPERFLKHRKDGMIEIIPLAYMRGRTLDDAFIILDEAQNTTLYQMKMFLTRIGFDANTVVTGDITQVDLDTAAESGLIQAQRILKNLKGVKFVYFSKKDVVRHPLVRKIINAFEKHEKKG